MEGGIDSARATAELVTVCCREARSGWPARDRWRNEDVWHETFLRLVQRIEDRRVAVDRPLQPLARKTAYRLFLREEERRRRLLRLTDTQLHRFRQSEEFLPDDEAEAGRRGVVLREALVRLCGEDQLDERDVLILTLRYIEGWSAEEVAQRLTISAAGVRKICSRKLKMLRGELAGEGMTDTSDFMASA